MHKLCVNNVGQFYFFGYLFAFLLIVSGSLLTLALVSMSTVATPNFCFLIFEVDLGCFYILL